MFSSKDAGISEDDLTRRAREAVRRRRLEPPPPSTPPVHLVVASPGDMGTRWATLQRAITEAEQYTTVGETLPPMHTVRGWRRRIAVPLAKLVLRVAKLVTNEQTSFNTETLGAIRAVRDVISEQTRTFEHRHGALERDGASRSEALAGEIERLRVDVDQRLSALAADAERRLADAEAAAARSAQSLEDLRALTRQGATDLAQLRTQVLLQERRVSMALEETRRTDGVPAAHDPTDLVVRADILDRLYVTFEDHFRGSRDDIKRRAHTHVPTVRDAGAGIPTRPVLDLACGRGEWLELLADEGLTATGVDLNPLLVDECRRRGLSVAHADVLAYLRTLPDQSLGAVTGFHLLEHVPFDTMVALLDDVVRVLRPGGVAIFETPNPTNLLVGACTFHLDPTHRNPLHPDTMRFLLEARGLVRVDVQPLHPAPPSMRFDDDGSPVTARLNEYLYGPQDFAVRGYRA